MIPKGRDIRPSLSYSHESMVLFVFGGTDLKPEATSNVTLRMYFLAKYLLSREALIKLEGNPAFLASVNTYACGGDP